MGKAKRGRKFIILPMSSLLKMEREQVWPLLPLLANRLCCRPFFLILLSCPPQTPRRTSPYCPPASSGHGTQNPCRPRRKRWHQQSESSVHDVRCDTKLAQNHECAHYQDGALCNHRIVFETVLAKSLFSHSPCDEAQHQNQYGAQDSRHVADDRCTDTGQYLQLQDIYALHCEEDYTTA